MIRQGVRPLTRAYAVLRSGCSLKDAREAVEVALPALVRRSLCNPGVVCREPNYLAGETMSKYGNGGWEDGETKERSWSPELSFGDPDAWRGGRGEHDDDAWRGDQHRKEWPRTLVGPEYLMWKRLADGREG